MPFGGGDHRLRFRWDMFNLTNTPRFDVGNVNMFPDITTTFGRYNGTLATCDGRPAAACSSRCGTSSSTRGAEACSPGPPEASSSGLFVHQEPRAACRFAGAPVSLGAARRRLERIHRDTLSDRDAKVA